MKISKPRSVFSIATAGYSNSKERSFKMKRKLIRFLFLILALTSLVFFIACQDTPVVNGGNDGGTENGEENGEENGSGEENGNESGNESGTPADHEHVFEGEWTKTLSPTADTEGTEVNTCTVCNKTISRTVDKLTVASIAVTAPPNQTFYYTNEKFNSQGMQITAYFTDGSSAVVNNYVLESGEELSSGAESVVLSYHGKTATVSVTVSPIIYDVRRDCVVKTAYAFYYQSDDIDFDAQNMRRHINPTPEDATSFNKIFLDAASFVDAVYYNAFGVGVLPVQSSKQGETPITIALYAKNNPTNPDVIGFWETANYTTAEERSERLSTVRGMLEIGDVIVTRIGSKSPSGGRVYIYLGNDQFMYCNGGSKNNYVHNGKSPEEAYDALNGNALVIESARNLFENKSSAHYLFYEKNGSKAFDFALIRPIARDLTATKQALGRLTIPTLSIEKSVDVGPYAAVFTGNTITYTITLSNKSEYAINNISFTDTIPKYVELVKASDNLTVDGNKLSWNGSVTSFGTVTIRYIVKVSSADPGSIIRSDRSEVNGVKLNSIINTVAGISEEKINTVVKTAKTYVDSSIGFSDPITVAKSIYKDSIGIDIFSYETVVEALDKLIDTRTSSYNPEAEYSGLMIPDLCGGNAIWEGNAADSNRVRLITKDYLTKGDIILAEYTNKDGETCSVVYIFLGSRNCLAINSVNGMCTQVTISNSIAQNILVSLYSYDKYAVIRPSMSYRAE